MRPAGFNSGLRSSAVCETREILSSLKRMTLTSLHYHSEEAFGCCTPLHEELFFALISLPVGLGFDFLRNSRARRRTREHEVDAEEDKEHNAPTCEQDKRPH